MRLIDADALTPSILWTWESGEDIEAVTLEDIDAAPTVCCEGCRYRDGDALCRRITSQFSTMFVDPLDGCSNFERRTP